MATYDTEIERWPNHNRSITFASYSRVDGRFDIEGRLLDSKAYDYRDRERGELKPGDAVHDIHVTVTIDAAMVVTAVAVRMAAVPFSICQGGMAPVESLVGVNMARGWRRALTERMGGAAGCTHLRELLLAVGTVAFQTVSALRDQRAFKAGRSDADATERPFFLDGCHSWSLNGPVAERYFPQFSRTSPEDN